MPGTFSQFYVHGVFAVQNRRALIKPEWDNDLYKYVTGIVQNKGQKMLAINGVEDHIHFLIGMKPSCCFSELVREIKKSSNKFINEQGFTPYQFSWQEGFGAFTHGHNSLDTCIRYIGNQKEHHRKLSFREEYLGFLKDYDVPFEEKYLFKWS